jgi:hypothetical protein
MLGKKAFEQLNLVVGEWAEQIFDPTNPQIVVVERTGTNQMDTSYSVQPSSGRHRMKPGIKPIDMEEFVKQESEAAEKRALAALQQISKTPLLAGPSKSASVDEFEDVPEIPSKSQKPIDPSLTDELDALLEGIGK